MLKNIFSYLDKNILKIFLVGFVFVIPLLPKLPLQMINYTYVALRLDDIYMGLFAVVFAISIIRKKVILPKNLTLLFIAFWIAVFISFLWGYYIQKTVIISHLGFLHSLRRIEYMFIFLVVLTQIKSRADFNFYVKLLLSSVLIFSMYGYGQKFFGFPAVQTMNPEFAKGYVLVLDPWARISSTFAGHYDLSATLTLLLPIIIAYAIATSKIRYYLLFILVVGVLVLSATRASYIGYLFSITALLLYLKKFKVLVFVLIATAVLTPLSDNLTNRISRTFQSTKVSIDTQTGDTKVTRRLKPDDLPPGDFGAKSSLGLPGQAVVNPSQLSNEEALAARLQIQDQVINDAIKDGKVYTPQEMNDMVDEIFKRQVFVTKYLPDISISTRLQVSWPRALRAFFKNPVLGSGPSSLGEATDGDYFRWLGEKGVVGTGLFLGIMFIVVSKVFKTARTMIRKNSYIFHGFVFGFIGVFINASTIDIFEASKFAYLFWFTAGLFYCGIRFYSRANINKLKL